MSVLKTQRLRLRPLLLVDVPRVATLGCDWDVARMISHMPYPFSYADAENWVESVTESLREDVWAIEYQGQFAGCIGYTRNSLSHGEIGYWLGKPYWGIGLATEAVQVLSSFIFSTEPFSFVTAAAFEDNAQSIQLLENLGFRLHHKEPRFAQARKGQVSTLVYSLPRSAGTMAIRKTAG